MKNKALFIVWFIVVVIVFGLLSTLGFIYKNKVNKYHDYEDKLVEAAKEYTNIHKYYPSENKSITVKVKDIIKEKLINKKDVISECDGKVVVTKHGYFDYKTYLKCKYYKTK